MIKNSIYYLLLMSFVLIMSCRQKEKPFDIIIDSVVQNNTFPLYCLRDKDYEYLGKSYFYYVILVKNISKDTVNLDLELYEDLDVNKKLVALNNNGHMVVAPEDSIGLTYRTDVKFSFNCDEDGNHNVYSIGDSLINSTKIYAIYKCVNGSNEYSDTLQIVRSFNFFVSNWDVDLTTYRRTLPKRFWPEIIRRTNTPTH